MDYMDRCRTDLVNSTPIDEADEILEVLSGVEQEAKKYANDIKDKLNTMEQIKQSYYRNLKPAHLKIDEYLASKGHKETGSALWFDAHIIMDRVLSERVKRMIYGNEDM